MLSFSMSSPDWDWSFSAADLREQLSCSNSLSELIQRLGLSPCRTSRERVVGALWQLGLDTSHFHLVRRDRNPGVKRPLGEYLCTGGPPIEGVNLRRRLVKEGLREERCALCGSEPVWRDKPLVLQLDHINGEARDNRLENLRILCPNCHSQTPTFAGRNQAGRRQVHRCPGCGERVSGRSRRCRRCAGSRSLAAEWDGGGSEKT